MAKLDDRTKFVLQQSGNAFEMGSHVMVCTYPQFLKKDTRVPHMVARMWRRANSDEIPAASGAAFKEKEPLQEKKEPLNESSAKPAVPARRKVPLPEDLELDGAIGAELGMWDSTKSSPVARTTPFLKTSELARAIQRDLSAALVSRAKAFILYDPVDASAYMPFLCLARNSADLQWAVDTFHDLGDSDVGHIRSNGQNGSGFTDHIRRSAFTRCEEESVGRMAFIPIPGLSCKNNWGVEIDWGVEIENEVLNFCVYDAQLPLQ